MKIVILKITRVKSIIVNIKICCVVRLKDRDNTTCRFDILLILNISLYLAKYTVVTHNDLKLNSNISIALRNHIIFDLVLS